MIPVVTATFELTDDEVAAAEEALGHGALTSPRFTLTQGYRADDQWHFEYSERAIVAHLVGQLDATAQGAVGAAGTVADLLSLLEEQPELHSSSQAVMDKVKSWGRTGWHCVLAQVESKLPRFVYFEDYDRMPGKIAVPDLAKRKATGDLNRGETALFNLLEMAGADIEEFDDQSNNERLIRLIEESRSNRGSSGGHWVIV